MKITQAQFLKLFSNTGFRYFTEGGIEGAPESTFTIKKELNEKGYGSFFTVNGFKNGEKTENMISLNSFFVDIDWEKGISQANKKQKMSEMYMEASEKGMPMPTVVVETQKGMHMYWILESPIIKGEGWEDIVNEYRGITSSIISYFGGDVGAKDPTRVLRLPETKHWKDPKNPFTISIWTKELGPKHTFEEIKKAFPIAKEIEKKKVDRGDFPQDISDGIELQYPRISRPSSIALLKKTGGHIKEGTRNASLHIAATIYRDAKKTIQEAYAYFDEYHGIAKERGINAIRATIRSAYNGGYVYGMNHDLVKPHVTKEERDTLSATAKVLFKSKKEQDETFFLDYERRILEKHPTLILDKISEFYEYEKGVYVRRTDDEISAMVFSALDEDNLNKYASRSKVNDKIAALSALIIGKPFNPDKNPDIVNVKNGLLNIKTFELLPHTPDYLSIAQSPVEYHPEATSPVWDKFMEEVTCGEKDQAYLLQQFAGYCLTTETRHEKALIIQGTGGNGKGKFMHALRSIVGEQSCSNVKLRSLNERFGLKSLHGKKLNVIDEISGHYFESDIIKGIISGEPLSAEVKNKQEMFEFRPFAKIIFTVNDLPRINDTSDGIYRRLIIMTFDQSFSEEVIGAKKEKDIYLNEKIDAELSGVLNWALEGLKNLRTDGKFVISEKNTTEMIRFKRENSPLAEYIESEYEKEENETVSFETLYAGYKLECAKNGNKAKSNNNIGKELRQMGFRMEYDGKKPSVKGLRSNF